MKKWTTVLGMCLVVCLIGGTLFGGNIYAYNQKTLLNEQNQISESLTEHIQKTAKNSALQAQATKKGLAEVYLDGTAGDDNNNGDEGTPVKTFEKAREMLAANGTILLKSIIQIDHANTTLSSLEGQGTITIKRNPGCATMVWVSDGTVNLENIILDGNAVNEVMVQGAGKSTINVKDGAVLKNNNNNTISMYGENTHFNMSGGEITECGAYSGAVHLSGGTHTISGGSIHNNDTIPVSIINLHGTGGTDMDGFATLTMSGGDISNNTLPSTMSGAAGVLVARSNFIMTGGEIKNNSSTSATGGIAQQGFGTEVTINGGKIMNNKTSGKYGTAGGIFVSGGTLKFLSGEVSNNEGIYAGGICVSGYNTATSFILDGGTVSGNKATIFEGKGGGDGGGIAVEYKAQAEIKSGVIENNQAAKSGGGIWCAGNKSISISGGTIRNNTANKNGGGIYIGDQTIDMTGGTVENNVAQNNGGGIYIGWSTVFNMDGVTIQGNRANAGGGIYNENDTNTVDLKAVVIQKNSATTTGGGICNKNALTADNQTVVSGNSAALGGGIYNENVSTLNDVKISDNQAEKQGGGIYINSTGTVNLFGGTLTGNTTKGTGNGVFLDTYDTTPSNATLNLKGNLDLSDGIYIYSKDKNSNAVTSKVNVVGAITTPHKVLLDVNPYTVGYAAINFNGVIPDPNNFNLVNQDWYLQPNESKSALLLAQKLKFHITSSASVGGTISPLGDVEVTDGNNQKFTITPDEGYHIDDVKVDGKSVGAVTEYTFNNVVANHEIAVTFKSNTKYKITATATKGGTISPLGDVEVTDGNNQKFTITSDEGYHIDDVKVDGKSVGAVTEYTFNNVVANHEIAVTFKPTITSFEISIDGSDHGTVTPNGVVTVNEGGNLAITLKPDEGYTIDKVLFDGKELQNISTMKNVARFANSDIATLNENTLNISNITVNHTIKISFKKVDKPIEPPQPTNPDKPNTPGTNQDSLHNVQTGDISFTLIYLFILMSSLTVIISIFIYKKRISIKKK